MLRRYPDVQRWVQTGDVLQNSLLRLLRALEQIRPHSVRDFFGLAGEQMRRELLDLARHFNGPEGMAAHHVSGVHSEAEERAPLEPADTRDEPGEMEKWVAFHESVASLPDEERETVGLIYYHGWTQQAVADLLQASVRTVQRRWERAMVRLREATS